MFKKAAVIFILVFGISFLVNRFFFSRSDENSLSSPKSANPTEIAQKVTISPATSQNELLQKIKNLFFETNPDIDFGIGIYDFKSGTYFGYNDEKVQHAASVSKTLTAAYLLKNVETGKVDLSNRMGTYNIEFNLKQLVNQSNNISWQMIDNLLGIEPQNEFARSIGITSFDLQENTMSPKDAALFFTKLYRNEILSEPYQRKLFSYMQNTETENLITPAIPKDIPLYHKSGLYDGEVHDVAIIDHPTRPFVLAIFTVNKLYPDYEGRAKLIQKVTQEIFVYFDSLP